MYALLDEKNVVVAVGERYKETSTGVWMNGILFPRSFTGVEITEGAIPQIHKIENGVVVRNEDYVMPDFYTPEPEPVEPTQEELNTMALMEGIAGLYETQIALEDRIATDNLTVMEGIAGLFEAQMGGM